MAQRRNSTGTKERELLRLGRKTAGTETRRRTCDGERNMNSSRASKLTRKGKTKTISTVSTADLTQSLPEVSPSGAKNLIGLKEVAECDAEDEDRKEKDSLIDIYRRVQRKIEEQRAEMENLARKSVPNDFSSGNYVKRSMESPHERKFTYMKLPGVSTRSNMSYPFNSASMGNTDDENIARTEAHPNYKKIFRFIETKCIPLPSIQNNPSELHSTFAVNSSKMRTIPEVRLKLFKNLDDFCFSKTKQPFSSYEAFDFPSTGQHRAI